jgi:hypothetical protein
VLRSLSEDPQIKEIENLYKIGFSSQPVQQRIQNTEREPTYLMAGVIMVTEFQTYNLNPQQLELLLHKFFASALIGIDPLMLKKLTHPPFHSIFCSAF